MGFLPVVLEFSGRRVVLVGGGEVATRKAELFVKADARLMVVAPQVSGGLASAAEEGKCELLLRPYRQGDLAGASLAVAATDRPEVNRQVARDAAALGIPVNVAYPAAEGDCILPATLSVGGLQLAVSTGGRCPAFARWLLQQLAQQFGDEYGAALQLAASVREKLLTERGERAYNTRILAELLAADLPRLFREGRIADIDSLLQRVAGTAYSLEHLTPRTESQWTSSSS